VRYRPIALFLACLVPLLAAPSSAEPVFGQDALSEDPSRPRLTRDERYAAWGMSCAVAAGGTGQPQERCMLSQVVGTQGKVVLGVTVDYLDSAHVPTMRLRFSPGADRKAGVGFKIDDQPEMRLPISDCNTRHCEAVGRLTPPVLAQWKSGKLAQLAFIQEGGRQALLPIPLTGFRDAMSALDRQRK
jgi:invasion protein IalB